MKGKRLRLIVKTSRSKVVFGTVELSTLTLKVKRPDTLHPVCELMGTG